MTPDILLKIDRLKEIAQSIMEAQSLIGDYANLDAAPFVKSTGIEDVKDSMQRLSAEFMFRHLQVGSAVSDWNKQTYRETDIYQRV